MPDDRPHMTVDPQVQGGEPCIAGTRITAMSIAQMVWDGWTMEDFAREFRTLNGAQILMACWYASIHVSGVWRRSWLVWARGIDWHLLDWLADYQDIPLPPSSKEANQCQNS